MGGPGSGRKRKPKVIRIAEGSRPDRTNDEEPEFAPKTPTAPADLDRTGKAKWRQMCKMLSPHGLMSEEYADSLYLYCRSWSRMRALQKEIDAVGVAEAGPLLGRIHTAEDVCRRLLTEFGLTPASKTKVMAVATPDKEPEWKQFMGSAKKA